MGERPLDPQNSAFAPAYTRVDAGLRYTFTAGGQEVTLRANVKNLFDTYYWVVGQEYTSVIPGTPRTWSVSARVAF